MVTRGTSGSKAASSTLSNKARAKPPTPHYLGGSNNLVGERHRRQVAETTLQETKLSLRTVTHELVPQVEELAKAIKTIQIEKHQQLDLDEAAQEILEDMQQQLNAIEIQQNNFPRAVEDRLDQLMQQISEQTTADKYELKLLVAHVQDCQDDLIAEFRLLNHELTASHEFLTKRMNAVDDAVDCVRKEVARAGELQYEAKQSLSERVSELDEKLFGFDKELLKIKLALPSAVAAQMPTAFSDQVSSGKLAELPLGGMALQHKLQEISQDIVSLKADAITYRAADRKQFDGFTNRLRESLKSHQSLKKELDTRLQQMQLCYDQMTTKIPSELSKRLLKAQALWDGELQHLRACVQQIEADRANEKARDQRVSRLHLENGQDHSNLDQLLFELQHKAEHVDELQNDLSGLRDEVQLLHDGQESTPWPKSDVLFLDQLKALSSSVKRVERDVLDLYDWSRDRVAQLEEQVTYASEMLAYFTKHAKILPK